MKPGNPNIENLLPNINTYLQSTNHKYAISVEGLEELICKIQSKTGLNKEQVEVIVKLIFHEIRNEILDGKAVSLHPIGTMSFKKIKTKSNKNKSHYKAIAGFNNRFLFTRKMRAYDGTS